MIRAYKYMLIYTVGGAGYGALELAFRGRTHWSMLLAGGACLSLLYAISVKSRRPLWQKCVMGGAVITGIELITGLIVNVGLGWEVWNYSDIPMNLMGQICPRFTLLWCLLCVPVMPLCRYMGRKAV